MNKHLSTFRFWHYASWAFIACSMMLAAYFAVSDAESETNHRAAIAKRAHKAAAAMCRAEGLTAVWRNSTTMECVELQQ